MATVSTDQASATKPVSGHGFAGTKKQAYGIYTVTASLPAATIIRMCRVPKGAIIMGGILRGSGVEVTSNTLDIDVGYEGNGTDTADPDAFGNFGTLFATVIAGTKPEQGYSYPLGGVLIATGPKTLAAETIIGLTVVASATTFTSGVLSLVVDYIVP